MCEQVFCVLRVATKKRKNLSTFNISFVNSFEDYEGHSRFCWTQSQQGLLKSAFFIGYVLLQVHGGSLAEKFGTKIVLGLCILSTSVLTLLTPLAATWNFWALFAIRLLIGLAESVTFPSLPPLVQRLVY